MADDRRNYYVTFGQRHRTEPHPVLADAHPDGWVLVRATSEPQARAAVRQYLQDAYSMLYLESEFGPDRRAHYPRGEVGRIVVPRELSADG